MTNKKMAELWLGQTRSDVSYARQKMSIRNGVLYSYGTPIARLFTLSTGEQLAIINTQHYSVTTNGKHIRAAFDAIHDTDIRHHTTQHFEKFFSKCKEEKLLSNIYKDYDVALKEIDETIQNTSYGLRVKKLNTLREELVEEYEHLIDWIKEQLN